MKSRSDRVVNLLRLFFGTADGDHSQLGLLRAIRNASAVLSKRTGERDGFELRVLQCFFVGGFVIAGISRADVVRIRGDGARNARRIEKRSDFGGETDAVGFGFALDEIRDAGNDRLGGADDGIGGTDRVFERFGRLLDGADGIADVADGFGALGRRLGANLGRSRRARGRAESGEESDHFERTHDLVDDDRCARGVVDGGAHAAEHPFGAVDSRSVAPADKGDAGESSFARLVAQTAVVLVSRRARRGFHTGRNLDVLGAARRDAAFVALILTIHGAYV